MFLVKLRSQFFTCKTAAAGHSSPGTRAHHSDLYLLPNQTKQTQHSNTSADWTLKCWCDKRRSEKHCVRNPVRKKKGRLLQLVPKFTATLIGQKNDSWKHHLPRTIKYPLESSSLLLCGRTNLTMWATTERVKQLTGEPLAFTLREQRRAAAAHFNFSTVRTKKKKIWLKKRHHVIERSSGFLKKGSGNVLREQSDPGNSANGSMFSCNKAKLEYTIKRGGAECHQKGIEIFWPRFWHNRNSS